MSSSTTLVNNVPLLSLNRGTFIFKASGALDIQIQLGSEGYSTVTGGVIASVQSSEIELPDCDIQITNAGAETLILSRSR